jgi:hypothetical protein
VLPNSAASPDLQESHEPAKQEQPGFRYADPHRIRIANKQDSNHFRDRALSN